MGNLPSLGQTHGAQVSAVVDTPSFRLTGLGWPMDASFPRTRAPDKCSDPSFFRRAQHRVVGWQMPSAARTSLLEVAYRQLQVPCPFLGNAKF